MNCFSFNGRLKGCALGRALGIFPRLKCRDLRAHPRLLLERRDEDIVRHLDGVLAGQTERLGPIPIRPIHPIPTHRLRVNARVCG